MESDDNNLIENGELFVNDSLVVFSEDDENEEVIVKQKHKHRIISSDDESEKETFDQNQIVAITDENVNQKKVEGFKLIDSDSDSTPSERNMEIDSPKKVKKLKNKTERDRLRKLSIESSDSGNSISDEEETTNKKKLSRSIKGICDDDTDSSNSGEKHSDNEGVAVNDTARPAKRMSAKAAEEQLKQIQSYSQKFARESNINVPYHKPRQYSLKEFLNRRSVTKPSSLISGRKESKKAVLEIKMSKEELEIYACRIEERQREARKFFKNENDIQDKKPVENLKSTPEKQSESMAEDNKTHVTNSELLLNENGLENVDIEIEKEMDEIQETAIQSMIILPTETSNEEPIAIEKILEREQMTSDDLIEESMLEDEQTEGVLTKEIDYDLNDFDKKIPKLTLKGDPSSIIDLDTGEILTKKCTLSGAEELFERFKKHTTKITPKDTAQMGVVTTSHGKVDVDVITVQIHDENGIMNSSAPGSAYVKLKKSLQEQMAIKRKEECLRRLKTIEKERKEELEEFSDCGYNDEEEIEDCSDEIDEELQEDATVESEMIDTNVDVEDAMHNKEVEEMDEISLNQEVNNESENSLLSSDSESSQNNDTNCNKAIKKGRIIMASDDSDDESIKEHQNEPEQLFNKSVSDMFLSQQDDIESPIPTRQPVLETIPLFPFNATQSSSYSQLDEPLEDELMGLCSGRFESTQKFPKTQDMLFSQSQGGGVDPNELMALCSGTFQTQCVDSSAVETPSMIAEVEESLERTNTLKAIFESSDEEAADEINLDENNFNKIKRKRRIVIDDDDDDNDGDDENKINYSDKSAAEEDEPEADNILNNLVDYDSEENEVEVQMDKPKLEKFVSTNFFENEAELSESEWGSADEDEKDLNQYDIELGDEDDFDARKIQQELERMHVRRVLDQDNREIKVIQEMLFHEEENDGADRDRKFRWKNVDNMFNPEEGRRILDDNEHASDEENEELWRKMRYERESVLQEQINSSNSLPTTPVNLESTIKKKLTIIKSITPSSQSDANSQQDSPFLITKNVRTVNLARSSFLSRDQATLSRLANLTKQSQNESEDGTIKIAGNGRNYVFSTLSPSVEQKILPTKRKCDENLNMNTNLKKKKDNGAGAIQSQNQLIIDKLI